MSLSELIRVSFSLITYGLLMDSFDFFDFFFPFLFNEITLYSRFSLHSCCAASR